MPNQSTIREKSLGKQSKRTQFRTILVDWIIKKEVLSILYSVTLLQTAKEAFLCAKEIKEDHLKQALI